VRPLAKGKEAKRIGLIGHGSGALPALVLVGLLVPGLRVADAQDRSLSFGGELDANSRYVWRGLPQSRGPAAQPSVWVSFTDFTFTPWANFVLGSEENRWKFNEVDLSVAYSKEWIGLSFEPSFAYYVYPNQPDVPATGELSLGLSYQLGPVEFSTSHTVDLFEYRGAYFGDLGLEYSRDVLNDRAGFEAGGRVGVGSSRFNDAYIGEPRFALNTAGVTVGMPVSVFGCLRVRPHAELSTVIDRALRERLAADGQPAAVVSFGLSLEMEP